MKTRLLFFILLLAAFNVNVTAQNAGDLDPTFNIGIGANLYVHTSAIQTDGKIIIGGVFTSYNGTAMNSIVRLNTNGSLDTSFNIGTGASSVVSSIAIQSDGKIIIGGGFTSYNGTNINRIARLNTNGSLDTSFNVGTGPNNEVFATAIQSDGKIIIGGAFTFYNGISRNRIARLNTDGSLDTSFVVGTGVGGFIKTISIQTDGKIIIGGNFYNYNGMLINRAARLNTNGSLDGTFYSMPGLDNIVESSAVQSDGKFIIGGSFMSYSNTVVNNIARFNTNGSLDTTFNVGTGTTGGVTTIAIQTDGKIIIGGGFSSFNGTPINKVARLNTDGSLDTSFNLGTGANGTIHTAAIQSDGKIIIAGQFGYYNGISQNYITRLYDCPYTTSTQTVMACDSFVWNGNTYNISGIYMGTIPNSASCDSIMTLNLTINSLNASYTSIDNGGGNYTFTNTSTGSFTQTHWAFGDGTTSTLANPTHTFNANGTYVVVLTINDSTANTTCTNYYLDTLVVTGVVNPVPCAAGFVMYPDGNNNVTVVNSSIGNNLTYFWDFGDGDTSTMQLPSHTYATAGPFYLCLTVNDGASCVDTYCDSIGINGVLFNKQTGFSINVIAPPVVVGVDEQGALATEVIIYPNPTKDEFVVELTNFSPSTQINIISVEGKMVYTNSSINTNKINVDAANWSRGIYIVKITDKQSSKVVKLVKQ